MHQWFTDLLVDFGPNESRSPRDDNKKGNAVAVVLAYPPPITNLSTEAGFEGLQGFVRGRPLKND
jgi:hypothetical protein